MPLHRIQFLGLAALLVLPPVILGQDAPAQRLAEPEAAAQKQSEKVIRDLFKEEYSKRALADQQALARKLLQQGIDTQNDPATRFVLFREAREIAVKYGDVETALSAVTEMAKYYEIDGLALKAKILIAMVSAAKSPEAASALADACLEVIDEAVQGEKYDVAKSLVSKAETAAKAAKDASKTLQAQKKSKEIEDLARESQKAKEAAKALEANPADPDASLALGRYLLMKGDVGKALTLLSKGADPLLRAAADKELAAPTKTEEQAAVGDAWWEVADKEKNAAVKAVLQARAKENYEKAVVELSGIAKTRVTKRLEEMKGGQFNALQKQRTWIDLMPLIDIRTDTVSGRWTLRSGVLMSDGSGSARIEIPYMPPEEYDYRCIFRKKEGNGEVNQIMFASGKPVLMHWGAFDNTKSGWQHDIGGKQVSHSIESGRSYEAVVLVRKNGCSATMDGKMIIGNTDIGLFTKDHDAWALKTKNCVGVGANSLAEFVKIHIREVTGTGRRLR